MLACSRLRCCSSQLLETVGKTVCGCMGGGAEGTENEDRSAFIEGFWEVLEVVETSIRYN